MEPTDGHALHRHVRDLECGIDCWRSGRDEYHAGQRDGAHPRNWSAQSHWRAEARHPPAIHAGSHYSHGNRRGLRYPAGSGGGVDDPSSLAVVAGEDVYILDGVWLFRVGGSGTDLWNLSRVEGGEP